MTSSEIVGCFSVLFAILLSLLLFFILIFLTPSIEIQDLSQINNQSSNKLEKNHNINVKIEGKIHQAELFPKEYVGFFEARKICRSNNMSLPHQGFEILQTKDMDQIPSGVFWIDAFVNSNFSIVCPWKGSDTNIIEKMLEEALEGFQRKILGKY